MDNDDPRKWRLKRRGESKSFGPYTEEQLRGFLRDKRVAEEDLVSDGQRTRRLGDLLADPAAPPPPMPDSRTSAESGETDEADSRRWSWGAFGLGLIWVIGNRVWWPGLLMVLMYVLLAGGIIVIADTNLATVSSAVEGLKEGIPGLLIGFVPFLAFSIYLGIKGHHLAQRNRDFVSPSQFRRAMRAWDKAGLAVAITVVVLSGWGIPSFRSSAIEAQGSSCMSNLKQIDLAILMWALDHGERFPPHQAWQETIYSYVRNEDLFYCPSGTRYIYNPSVAGRYLQDVPYPAHTVLLYEVDSSGQPAFDAHPVVSIYDHRTGRRSSEPIDHMNVAFADGSCRAVSEAEADKYIWQLR